MQQVNFFSKGLAMFLGLFLSLNFNTLNAQCEADFGSLTNPAICFKSDTTATIQTAKAAGTVVPTGFEIL